MSPVQMGAYSTTDPDPVFPELSGIRIGSNIVIVWNENSNQQSFHKVKAAVSTDQGNSFNVIELASSGEAIASPVVTPLENGGFVLAYDTPDPTNNRNIVIREYDPAFVPIGNPVTLNVADDVEPTLSRLLDGRLVVSWESDRGSHAQILDPRTEAKLWAAPDGRDYQFVGTNWGDDLTGGGGRDFLWGGDDRDTLRGGDNADTLKGEAGNDILEGGAGADTLDGGAGTADTAWYLTGSAGVRVDLRSGTGEFGEAQGDVLIGIETIVGSLGNDTLSGDDNGNALNGGGFASDDTGSGNDILTGRGGNDHLNGSGGNDTLDGGIGADDMVGGLGFDVATYAGSTAGVRVDLQAGAGESGDAQGDVLQGIEGLIGSFSNDILLGDDGANELSGGGAFNGSDGGNDILLGRGGNDTLTGNGGNDTLDGGTGADTLFGGEGFDYARYYGSTAGVTVDLQTHNGQNGDAQGDVLSGIEGIIGSGFGDALSGDDSGNSLDGGSSSASDHDLLLGRGGNDTLTGSGGDDTLEGGAGVDSLSGGQGFDFARYSGSTGWVWVDLQSGEGATGDAHGDILLGIEGIIGSSHGDTLLGDDGGNIIYGGASTDEFGGRDLLVGRDGNDQLFGEGGIDTLNGGAGADTLSGGAGYDYAVYESSATPVTIDLRDGKGHGGDAEGDVLIGIEAVIGSSGNDTFISGAGNDELIGREGQDVAQFSGNKADYTISFGGQGSAIVRDNRGLDGQDLLAGIEYLKFADGTWSLDDFPRNIPSPPRLNGGITVSVNENGDFFGNLSATDVETPASGITYHFDTTRGDGGNAHGMFVIDNFDKRLRLASGRNLDHEARQSYTVYVKAFDGADYGPVQALTINIADMNEAPTDITFGAAQNIMRAGVTEAGVNVVAAAAVDPDAGFRNNKFAFLVNGELVTQDGKFSIDDDTGQITTNAAIRNEDVGEKILRVVTYDPDPQLSHVRIEEDYTVNILNASRPVVQFDTLSVSTPEGSGSGGPTAFTFKLVRDLPGSPSTVRWTVNLGTADAGDFSGVLSGDVEFGDDETIKFFTVWVNKDSLAERDETFTVSLSAVDGNTMIGPNGTASGTILDDDNRAPDIPAGTFEVDEGVAAGMVVATLQATDADGHPVTYSFRGEGATSADGRFRIEGNQIKVNRVTFVDEDEPVTYAVTATDGFATVQGNVTITVNDLNSPPTNTPPTVTNPAYSSSVAHDATTGLPTPFAGVTFADDGIGGTDVTVTITLDTAAEGAIVIPTGVAGSYNPATGVYTLTGTVADVQAAVRSLQFNPADRGTNYGNVDTAFTVRIQDAGGLSDTNDSTITVTSTNPAPQVPTLSIATATAAVTEGDTGFVDYVFTVSRDLAGAASTVTWTVEGTHINAHDFEALTGQVQFAAHETTRQVVLRVRGDTQFEGNEVFRVALSNPISGTISTTNGSADGRIDNDDPGQNTAPTLTGGGITKVLDTGPNSRPFQGLQISDLDRDTLTLTVKFRKAYGDLMIPEGIQWTRNPNDNSGDYWVYTFTGKAEALEVTMDVLKFDAAPLPNTEVPGTIRDWIFDITVNDGIHENVTDEVQVKTLVGKAALTAAPIRELSAAGAPVGTLTAKDAEDKAFSYQIVLADGSVANTDGRFKIGADGRSIEVADGFKLDYEQARSHGLRLKVTVENGDTDLSFLQDVTIQVSDWASETAAGTVGHDRILANAGNDRLSGGDGNDTLMGGAGTDRLTGGNHNDWLYGGAGIDTLYGNHGKDIFVFNTKPNSRSNWDRITDWNKSYDTIRLENSVFKALKKTGWLSKSSFKLGSKAGDADDFVGYNKATGDLWYDSNGNKAGGQVIFAKIGANKSIAYNDFYVI
ncbi:Calx-beta domain-containing protein [Microvirga pakistanensis]|uniref:Calx-beta domain-containing protein n=1 Tax=Microvirga pakistanensis TaxID=1682650 RepID=UPI00141B374D|nr:Calx-beta domain-containing protein [Microvirga pakistanensis]